MSTLLCARAALAHISFASQAATIYNRNRRRKTLEISTQYDIMEKIEISMPCKLMLARRSFFALRHRRGRKNNVQNQVRRVRLPAGVSAADLCGRSVLPICILRTHGRAHAYLRRETTGDFGRICWIMSGIREIGRMHIGMTMDLVISFKITEQKLKS